MFLVKCNTIDETGNKSVAHFAPGRIIALIPGKLVTNGQEVMENKLIVPKTVSIVQILLHASVRLACTDSIDYLLGQVEEVVKANK
jgi:hypothetical protein